MLLSSVVTSSFARIRVPVVIFVLLIATSETFAQTISELRKLPKDTLVKMAINKIDYPSFDVSAFEQISVWVNNKRGQFEVRFDNHLYFVPREGRFLYTIYMDLISGQFGASVMGQGSNPEPEIFKPTLSQTSEIGFVVSKIMEDKRLSKLFESSRTDGHVTITDMGVHYAVSIETPNENTGFTMDKKTGDINAIQTWYKELMSRPRENVRIY